MTDAGAPPNSDSASQAGNAPYRVLARKYRPSSFDDLIGQEAVVRTVSNAFETGRIPQAWILTGVRGVGKTTTARILARALNYEMPDGSVKGPTIHMPNLGVHCQAIMESRHMDVLEMDAASHTGVDDVRQINDSVRYAPASARYKVYIIDEVHMLSTAAFNAFLKTLEEPPEHAKFVFATTEIRKVPVTVLSRCQRFDLRRVEADVLMKHLASIAAKESVEIEPEALGIIARAAEGSVRDSLSLLDQAIAHAAGTVKADAVRQMLGLADRTRVIDLFDSLARGDIAAAFKEFRDQYDVGADPIVVLSDLAEFVNFVTRVKIVPATADNVAYGETERVRARDFASKISMRVLSRMWQMLLKGITEVQAATRPAAAAEMVLVRIAYVADLPTPDEAIRMLEQNGGGSPVVSGGSAARSAPAAPVASAAPAVSAAPMRAPTSSPSSFGGGAARPQMAAPAPDPQAAAPQLRITSFTQLVALAGQKRDIMTKAALEADMRLVRFEEGRLEVALEPNASRTMITELARKFELWTGRRWTVIVSNEQGQPTLRSVNQAAKQEHARTAEADPRVQEVLSRFPGSKVVEVRRLAPETPESNINADYGSDDPPDGSDTDDDL
ncbi:MULTISPECIES: DNA polymerase III subunit gamma/tau [Bradyrhizobium]|uniref:DNA polymerase III subunit gamma/tau n=2 Tax=Bradyrhizobium diazoefficiens TaxID=1355477 RepID=Q89BN2_BRADU|nr:DNA polymerase III subunit gamma/tau [Bradyrhizobium diazoefficiens]MBP1061561.1 DNA polymerase-3 subunit gamma/tau [Bradyrhizobium japonicum]AND92954.1 DNA polymerase III subunits gamma and tau [Bradyrhizobium diazoefficiens USDA 110]AWO94794.1 DNA polymerase III subunit gamma/tau [Bradyrhizobium diazoefficiens]PDT56610.1 DNA polymerase III subunit gamma/tau [Bradyrhizobium diazoefficiens]QBP26844.1 DNA polymerase III subunit gamma/tau [Bradyrhizobium diazoefficiens]